MNQLKIIKASLNQSSNKSALNQSRSSKVTLNQSRSNKAKIPWNLIIVNYLRLDMLQMKLYRTPKVYQTLNNQVLKTNLSYNQNLSKILKALRQQSKLTMRWIRLRRLRILLRVWMKNFSKISQKSTMLKLKLVRIFLL